ncbi:protein ECT2-like [Panulirus ornatus]|uniref:protein ECT2-like n=1 Tax=Panulirus ornatus TaxID=150431 RepID=UPI003A8801B0
MAELTQPSIMINADVTSVSRVEGESDADPRICLVGNLVEDVETLEAAKKFNVPVVTSETGLEYVSDVSYCTYFILADFESQEFEELNKTGARLLGKPALLEYSESGILTYTRRPVFCQVMKDVILVFTGFRKKAEVSRLLKLVHYMGGSVKNEIKENVTHLLAYSSTGEKYQYAITFSIPVMGEDWVHAAWAHRDEAMARADTDAMAKYKLKVFQNLRIVLVGFPAEEQGQMEDLVEQNGGILTTLDDQQATHVVLEDQTVTEKPPDCPARAHVVKAEWFWTSIQMEACPNEKLHLFEEMNLSNLVSPRHMFSSPSTPGSRSRRRKRLRETVQHLAQDDSASTLPSAPPARYCCSIFCSQQKNLVLEDQTVTEKPPDCPARAHVVKAEWFWTSIQMEACPNEKLHLFEEMKYLSHSADQTPISPPPVDLRQLSARQRVFHELVKTECNYVSILDAIEKVIKVPLENNLQPGGPMLDAQEIRYIFGNLPPIHEVHTRMRNELLHLAHNWTDDASIGEIILKYSSDLEKAYPPFINFFENMKEMLQKIFTERPRFHAFLKIAQNKPECGRQSLQELLIRPVQRLPSMSLLINDILKHTEKTSQDHTALEQALDKIKSVMTFINDDKRKTEAKLKLFEIHNDIEMCPPNLVASHRMYMSKVDVTELSDSCSGRGDTLTLFLFNDVLEICKKKSKYNSIKSPGRANLHSLKSIKTYKHLEMMNLAHIKRIVDIRETEDCHNVFALIVRSNQERLLTFTLLPDDINKSSFLKNLCRTVLNIVCRNDEENFLVSMDPHHLDIETSDVSLTNALSKALRFASRTGRKVSRAFSFNKSPSKLKRAVSTVMSPFGTLPQQSSLRGATSVNNLADLPFSGTPPTGGFAQPMATPTPRRRPLKHAH